MSVTTSRLWGHVPSQLSAPVTPILGLDSSTDTGTSNTDLKTNNPNPLITWTLGASDVIVGATLTLFRNSVQIVSHALVQNDLDTGLISVSPETQSDGTWNYTGTITRGGFVSAVSNTLTVLINTSLNAPTSPAIAPQSQTGTNPNNTSQTQPFIRMNIPAGIAAGDALCVQLSSGAPTLGSKTLSSTDISNGFADVQLSTLALGSYTLIGLFQHTASSPTTFSTNSTPLTVNVVTPATMSFIPYTLGQVNVVYVGTTPVASGAAPFSYAVHSGSLPTSLTISSSTGLISGTPSAASNFTGIVIRMTDANGEIVDTPSFSILIRAAAAVQAMFTDSKTDTSGSTTVTFTGCNIGATDANRLVVASFFALTFGQNNPTITSMTIGGVSATQVSGAYHNGGNSLVDTWYANLTTGTTATIIVNAGTFGLSQSILEVYRVVTATHAPTSGTNNGNFPGTSVSVAVTVPVNGIGICTVANNNVNNNPISNWTYTNAVADELSNQPSFGTFNSAGKAALIPATATVTGAQVDGGADLAAITVGVWGP